MASDIIVVSNFNYNSERQNIEFKCFAQLWIYVLVNYIIATRIIQSPSLNGSGPLSIIAHNMAIVVVVIVAAV